MIFNMVFEAKNWNQWQNLCLPEEEVCGRQHKGNQAGALMKELNREFGSSIDMVFEGANSHTILNWEI